MNIKNIHIIFTFIALALMVLSSPISYGGKKHVVKSKISDKTEDLTISSFSLSENDSDEEPLNIDDDGNDVQEITDSDLDIETEAVTEVLDLDDTDKISHFSINWNRTPEELESIGKEIIQEIEKTIMQIEAVPDEECSFESIIVPLENILYGKIMNEILSIVMLSKFYPDETVRNVSNNFQTSVGLIQMDIFLNRNLYQKVLKVKENIAKGKFKAPTSDEDQKLLELYELKFKRNGVSLTDEKLEQYAKVYKEIEALISEYKQCLIEDKTTVSFTKKELDGIPEPVLNYFDNTIKDGEKIYTIALSNPVSNVIIEYCKNESTREAFAVISGQICPSNVDVLKKIINLRLKKANLLGYPSHAHYQLEDKMAKNPENVFKFLQSLKEKVQPYGKKEIQELLELKKKEKEELNEPFDNTLHLWDYPYYARILSENKYGMDINEIKKYYPVNEVIKEIIDIYETLFSLKCVEVKDPSVWHSDVRQYDVYDKKTENYIGTFYLDLFNREGKNLDEGVTYPLSLGYMNEDGTRTYSSAGLLLNLANPLPNQPTLLKHSDIKTFFHELGHVFHILSSNTKWGSFHSFNAEHDFIEAPSQMLENWTWEPEILEKLSHHYQDYNKKIPKELINSIIQSKSSGTPFYILQTVYVSLIDLKLYSIEEEDENMDIIQSWDKVQEETQMIESVKDVWPMGAFPAIVTGYDVGYYGYLWSEVYSADMYTQFQKYGILNSEVGERYRNIVLSQGGSKDAMDLIKEFLGREPNDEAFIKNINY